MLLSVSVLRRGKLVRLWPYTQTCALVDNTALGRCVVLLGVALGSLGRYVFVCHDELMCTVEVTGKCVGEKKGVSQ